MENQDNQLLLLQLLRIISSSKYLVSKFPLSMLILGQKPCFLGPTIFEIPRYYGRYIRAELAISISEIPLNFSQLQSDARICCWKVFASYPRMSQNWPNNLSKGQQPLKILSFLFCKKIERNNKSKAIKYRRTCN